MKPYGMVTSTEELAYEYGNYTCGIFAVTPQPYMGGFYYDVRVKNSTIEHPDPSCVAKFLQLSAERRVTNLYNDSCQHT
ncbi:uncharacterized protein LOC142586886 isoform X2 [Dermacentor variabilis]|uniref:uncharacterized protein LOC142586886 isoform X2 n=1 Tax=Dermacentor variabilis TaxID=34621 RepID=UPI003F5B25D7